MDEKRMILELKDLMKIPEFKKIIFHKIKELKEIISLNPAYYQNIIKELEPKEIPKAPHLARELEFELILFGETIWIPWIQGSDSNAYEYIPEEVIDFILETETDVGLTQMRKNLHLGDRIFDLVFTKQTEVYITGSIIEKKVKGKKSGKKKVKKTSGQNVERTGNKKDNLRLLFENLSENDAYYQHTIIDFFVRWKPLLENGCIKSNAG